MSKKLKKNKNDFSYIVKETLPKLGVIKTEWDLKRFFYKNGNDTQLETDIKDAEKAYVLFIKKYKNKSFTANSKTLLPILIDFKKLCELKAHKGAYYFSYRLSLNAQDTEAEKKLNKLEERLTKLGNSILFFELALSKIPKATQKLFLSDPLLAEFHFHLFGIFQSAQFTLSEPEERILNLKSQTSRGMWIAGTEKILGATTISFKGQQVPLNGALMQFMDLPKKERYLMWNACVDALTKLGLVAENELNAVVTHKKVNDELRGYKKPYSATALSYDQEEKSIETLVSVVTTKGYELSKKFYAHKAKLNGGKLNYIDREDFSINLPTVSFETATQICRDAFYSFNKKYGEIFDKMLTSGQIDVYPKQGKSGGAFCSSSTNTPTLVLLNHASDFQSIRTLAHEMGHAIHADRSKMQSVLYDDHSIITAETASTFFEAVVGDRLLHTLTTKQKTAHLNNLICDKISTIMMCVARFSAELEIHQIIRSEGAMTWQEMSACLRRHLKAYCGNAIAFQETDSHWIISKMHFRMNFYQYSYAFGNLASSIMFKRYKEDESFKDKVEIFLTSGRVASVDDIFNSIGINLSSAKVLEEGLLILEQEINEFITLTSSKSK